MFKLLLAALLAVSSLSYAGSGAPKAKKAKAKATTCNPAACNPAACAPTSACKPGGLAYLSCPSFGKK
jgi:hypothetical protein